MVVTMVGGRRPPGGRWAWIPGAAWVLGAVLAPTDAAAVAGLAKRLPRRTLTTLRAESLINDGTALVLFAVASAAAVGETQPAPLALAGRFVGSYAGGIVAGLLAGGAVVAVRRRLDDPLREGTLSVLTPFLAFLLAELVHASGVVAVVVAGLVLSYAGPRVIRARSRMLAFAFWDLATFLINGGAVRAGRRAVPRAVGPRRRQPRACGRRSRSASRWSSSVRAWCGSHHAVRHPRRRPAGGAAHAAGRVAASARWRLGRLPRRGVAGRRARRAGDARDGTPFPTGT